MHQKSREVGFSAFFIGVTRFERATNARAFGRFSRCRSFCVRARPPPSRFFRHRRRSPSPSWSLTLVRHRGHIHQKSREAYFSAFFIGVTRFERATSWSRTKRSTELSHTPLYFVFVEILLPCGICIRATLTLASARPHSWRFFRRRRRAFRSSTELSHTPLYSRRNEFTTALLVYHRVWPVSSKCFNE